MKATLRIDKITCRMKFQRVKRLTTPLQFKGVVLIRERGYSSQLYTNCEDQTSAPTTLAQFGWNTTTPACSCRSACLMIHIILSPTTQLRSQAQLLTKRRGKYDLPFIVCKHPFRTSGRSVTWLHRSLSLSHCHRSFTAPGPAWPSPSLSTTVSELHTCAP